MDAAPLRDLRVIECTTFVAGPSGGMTLAQLGADVIRVDLPGGGSDLHRWPVHPGGTSLYWIGLNKGKRSVAIDYRSGEGRELLAALATAPGRGGGILLDNAVGLHGLDYDSLRRRREDMIHVRLQGHPDGRPAVDYTVNAGVGIPDMTGPETSAARVNHVLPSWDLLMGVTATSGLLAAVHRRALTGRGARIDLALADVALSAVGSLGWLGEAEVEGDRPRQGNYVYGSFGTDFATADGQQVMLVALTARQWRALCQATETTAVFSALEVSLGANLDDEASRYQHRHTLAAILRPWFGRRTLGDIDETLSQTRVLWGPYRSMSQIVEMVGRGEASVIARIEQPGVGPILASSSPLRWNQQVSPPREAPLLGSDTESVLAEVLQLTQAEIGRLDRSGAISMSGPARPGIEKRSDPVVPATVETLKGT